jgi:pimeloyl-ACP methyl ester carboxylesterase
MPPRAEHRVASRDGTALHIAEYGPPAAPTVVLAHGWLCAIGFWTQQIRALSTDLRVVAYDLRGHGKSAAPGPAGFTTDALADDLAAVLTETIPAGNRCVVVGHSMGAMSLVALAATYQGLLHEKVAAGVLANTGMSDVVTGSRMLRGPQSLRRLTAPVGRKLLASTAPLRRRPSKLALPLVRYLALSPSATPEQVAFCAYLFLETPRAVRGGFGAMLGTLDLRAAISRLDVPTVVVTGSADRLAAPARSRDYVHDLPQARLVELAGVGHMTPIQAPGAVEKEIRTLVTGYLVPKSDA